MIWQTVPIVKYNTLFNCYDNCPSYGISEDDCPGSRSKLGLGVSRLVANKASVPPPAGNESRGRAQRAAEIVRKAFPVYETHLV